MNKNDKSLRTPIICVMGHVDHGKTTLLDKIRGTSIVDKEDGAITQHIGATEVPISTIAIKCGNPELEKKFIVPGLLFIDTPGHQAFTSLRSRGGALADLAIITIDINEGFMPQTIESLKILKKFKTPFVVAANKIDRIHGWNSNKDSPFLLTYKAQNKHIKQMVDEKIYKIIGDLYELGFNSERYDRVTDFSKNIGIIPISAKTGEGIPDILMVLLGLAQKFLEFNLCYDAKSPGIGTVLEVKREKGLGATVDAILYDGTLKKGDTIVIGSLGNPIKTKIKAILKPNPLSEIRSEEKFKSVNKVTAAIGIKISAPNLENALAGAPIKVVSYDTVDDITKEIKSEIEAVRIDTSLDGILVKADTIGSLEALVNELKKENIKIRKADVGEISKRDIIDAAATNDKFHSVILGFNVNIRSDAKEKLDALSNIKIFSNTVIYSLIDDYVDWVQLEKQKSEKSVAELIIKSGRFELLPDSVFRQSKPAVIGVRVKGGIIKTNVDVMTEDGVVIGTIKGIQSQGKPINEARIGMEVAVAIEGVVAGRQIKDGDELYINVPERHVKILEQELIDSLKADEIETLEAFVKIKRKDNPFWAK